MKLPHHLLRTYRRYKEEEQTILAWIERAACDVISTTSHGKIPNPPGTQKIGSKARKQAHRDSKSSRVKNNSSAQISFQDDSHDVETGKSILDIIPLVTAIANNPRIASVPDEIAVRLTSVLEMRKACVKWFKGNTSQSDMEAREQNERHSFPVQLLEQALSILSPKISCGNAIPAKTSADTSKPFTASNVRDNIFEHLLPDLSSDLPCLPALSSCSSGNSFVPNALKDNHMIKDGRVQTEFNMAKFCLLRDIQQVEDFMVLELVRYSLDKANTDILSFLSDTAIDMVAKMEDSLFQTFDRDKCELGLFDTVVQPNNMFVYSSPLLRMQKVLSIHHNKIHNLTEGPWLRDKDAKFSSQSKYFGTTIDQQFLVELLFVEHMFHIPQEWTLGKSRFYSDSIPRYIRSFSLLPARQIEYCMVPASFAFAIRITLLATLILKDQPSVSFHRMSEMVGRYAELEKIRKDFWSTPDYRSDRVVTLWPKQALLVNSGNKYGDHAKTMGHSRTALSAYHMTCTLNDCETRMEYALTSICAMEFSNIYKLLAHLWNLLREEGYLKDGWQDLEYLLTALGEDVIFQSVRPTSAQDGFEGIRSRMNYGMGFTKKDVKALALSKISSRDNYIANITSKHKDRYTLDNYPLWTLLTKRNEYPVHYFDSTIDVELVTTATVIPNIIGQSPRRVRYDPNAQIKNKHELWKFRDSGPGLEPTLLLAGVKKGLLDELKVLDFDYLRFEQVISALVDRLAKDIDVFRGVCPAFVAEVTSVQKIQTLLTKVVHNSTPQLLIQIANTFKEWLHTSGYVGVKALRVPEQGPIRPDALLSYLRPEILDLVKRITKTQGLRQDVFTPAQMDVQSVKVTVSFEERILKAWNDHKTTRKSNALRPTTRVHSGLDLD